jgi:hypothetical protein
VTACAARVSVGLGLATAGRVDSLSPKILKTIFTLEPVIKVNGE